MSTDAELIAEARRYASRFPDDAYDCQLYVRLASALEAARAEEREACARVADEWTDADHIAHDMRQSHFPRRSPVQDAIAAAIRNRNRTPSPPASASKDDPNV